MGEQTAIVREEEAKLREIECRQTIFNHGKEWLHELKRPKFFYDNLVSMCHKCQMQRNREADPDRIEYNDYIEAFLNNHYATAGIDEIFDE